MKHEYSPMMIVALELSMIGTILERNLNGISEETLQKVEFLVDKMLSYGVNIDDISAEDVLESMFKKYGIK